MIPLATIAGWALGLVLLVALIVLILSVLEVACRVHQRRAPSCPDCGRGKVVAGRCTNHDCSHAWR